MTAVIEIPGSIASWMENPLVHNIIRSGLVLLIGLPLAALAARVVYRVAAVRFSAQAGLMLSRAVRWILFAVILATVLNQFGVKLGAALGAAGIVGIAVGFAAQTSLSNVISGFFLLGEKPFVLGDLIEVDGVTGLVDNIGMISASLRTLDNRSVRIPNETLVKSKVINITRNPIRRYDLEIGVSYNEDIDHVMRVLRETAEANEHCLDEPGPLVLFVGFGDSSINFLLGVWMAREDYLVARNTIARDVRQSFAREGIEIPFPHRVLAGGKAAAPVDVRTDRREKKTPN
ncbi:MAG: mechanosensitive ion channel family protein [Akkermansiaceae bacterium]|jgi:small-conductance mechanosensitive channel|nr:mechanosensitive ion channel family protein [Akkermansiaceae bacterium]MCU0776168.1 mechanosensitive ion channel family protein [Akkermansiaceae bacterium]